MNSGKRDSLARLAKTDWREAFELARQLADVRTRIQTLGWALRFASGNGIQEIVSAVEDSVGESDDAYVDTMALAWPLRAAVENSETVVPKSLLNAALAKCPEISPNSSRAEAAVLLVNALLPDGKDSVLPFVEVLKSIANDPFWRITRALTDVAILLNATDKDIALSIANAIPTESKRNQTIAKLESGETAKPRAFFW